MIVDLVDLVVRCVRLETVRSKGSDVVSSSMAYSSLELWKDGAFSLRAISISTSLSVGREAAVAAWTSMVAILLDLDGRPPKTASKLFHCI